MTAAASRLRIVANKPTDTWREPQLATAELIEVLASLARRTGPGGEYEKIGDVAIALVEALRANELDKLGRMLSEARKYAEAKGARLRKLTPRQAFDRA